MGADRAGDEGEGVFLGDELQRRAIQPLAAELHVLGDVLRDGAAALTRRGEAVEPRDALFALAAGQGLDGLDVARVRVAGGVQVTEGLRVRAGEGAVGQGLDLFDHLQQAIVAAGLEDRRRDGDGPDARGEQLVAVEVLRAAGEGDAHFAPELAGDAVAHLDRQREEAPPGHVHLVVRQLAARRVDGKGVRELQAELHAGLVGQCLQPLEHRHRVCPLQILAEVVVVEDDVVIAHAVERAARRLVAEDGGVALDEGVQMLFGDEIRRDALDLVRRTSVQRRERDAAGDARGDGVDERALLGEELLQSGLALAENGGPGCVRHAV